MKFISCHIAGFGKFVNQSFDLSGSLVEIKADNGWGKTTFAAFLESMLFGLDNGRGKGVIANERLKYEPWSGGVFGGSLTFSYAGRTYRIERTFGKTAGGDRVKLYDKNNMPCYDFGDNLSQLGEALLGIDKESYRRCTYLPQGERETDGLPQNLRSRLLTALGAGGGASDALERLEAADRALRAKRKPAKGKLDEIDDRLLYLAAQKADCERAGQAAKEAETALAQKRERLSALQETLREKEELKIRLSACEERVRSHQRAGEGTRSRKKKGGFFGLLFALFCAVLGATQIESLPWLGYPLLALGGVLTIVCAARMLAPEKSVKGEENAPPDVAAAQEEKTALQERLAAFPPTLETERDELLRYLGAESARIETLCLHAAERADYAAEEEKERQEKERLERRLLAIRAAKEILLRARGNMAARYLEPVERACKRYAAVLKGEQMEKMRFAADGTPLFEENGSMREAEYYSAGNRGLLDFCIRLGLVEALFTKELPVLVLDDPFTELDDERTARAKALVKELSKTYQILYCTCKKERSLQGK